MISESLNEAFSAGGYIDVRELRRLYYGRFNVLASFANDAKLPTSGMKGSKLLRPAGLVGHRVTDVVGRKVTTSMFYAHIYRIKGTSSYIDASIYGGDDLDDDIDLLKLLSYIDEEEVEAAVTSLKGNLNKTKFEQLWLILRHVVESASSGSPDELWKTILLDLGYLGVNDVRGTGLIGKKGTPLVLTLESNKVTKMDIMPIQKYRSDPRQRIWAKITKETKRMAPVRNRIAKQKTDKSRTKQEQKFV